MSKLTTEDKLNKYFAILVYHTVANKCSNKFKCGICAILTCPAHNPLHFSKAGCPSCATELRFICVSCNINPINLVDGFDECETCRKKR